MSNELITKVKQLSPFVSKSNAVSISLSMLTFGFPIGCESDILRLSPRKNLAENTCLDLDLDQKIRKKACA